MTRSRASTTSRLLPLAVFLTISAGVATAQVPPHHAVVATLNGAAPITTTGTSGLFMFPLPTTANPGPFTPTPITGLPADLTIARGTVGGAFGGAYGVAVRPSDGLVVATSLVPGNGTTSTSNVHLLTLRGTAVQSVTTLPLGVVRNGAFMGAPGLSWFPDHQRQLMGAGSPSGFVAGSGPAAQSPIVMLDLSGPTPVLSAVPVTGLGGIVEGTTVAADGKTAYAVMKTLSSSPPWDLYRVNVDATDPAYGTTTLLYSWGSELTRSPSIDADGILSVAAVDTAAGRTRFFSIDTNTTPVTATSVSTTPQQLTVFGPAVDGATGMALYASNDWPGTVGGAYSAAIVVGDRQTGAVTPLVAPPPGGWAILAQIAIHSTMSSYGVDSPAANRYRITTDPNPGGLPEIGNANFSLTVRSSGAPSMLTTLVVGAAPLSLEIGNIELLARPDVLLPIPNTANGAIAHLPIPADPALVSSQFFCQTVHLEGNGALGASQGVQVQIVQ